MTKLAIDSTSLEFLVINREIFIPKREIGRFSLFDQKSGDLPPNRETWKLCICPFPDESVQMFTKFGANRSSRLVDFPDFCIL